MIRILSTVLPAASDGVLPGFSLGEDHPQRNLAVLGSPFAPNLHVLVGTSLAHLFGAPNGHLHNNPEDLLVALRADVSLVKGALDFRVLRRQHVLPGRTLVQHATRG